MQTKPLLFISIAALYALAAFAVYKGGYFNPFRLAFFAFYGLKSILLSVRLGEENTNYE